MDYKEIFSNKVTEHKSLTKDDNKRVWMMIILGAVTGIFSFFIGAFFSILMIIIVQLLLDLHIDYLIHFSFATFSLGILLFMLFRLSQWIDMAQLRRIFIISSIIIYVLFLVLFSINTGLFDGGFSVEY